MTAKYVGVAGTHSTGKSTFIKTLSRELEKRNKRVRYVADKASLCRRVGFPILRDHTFESSLWIMTTVIRAELAAGLIADVVLVDRPVPDAIGYLDAALEYQGRSIAVEQRRYLHELSAHHCRQYSMILKTVVDESISLGEGRDDDRSFRALVDRKLEAYFHTSGVPRVLLTHDGHEAAASTVLSTLGLL